MQTDLPTQLEQISNGLAERGYAIVDSFLLDHEVGDILQTDEFKNGKYILKKPE